MRGKWGSRPQGLREPYYHPIKASKSSDSTLLTLEFKNPRIIYQLYSDGCRVMRILCRYTTWYTSYMVHYMVY
ncbi:hypothetical protein ACN38_g6561 [Penicillium nordicum]|uniref:Uncharacterized protein n=1 Tax=Penicillium nordicum TaxID=229535 RepID=A0A0M9WF54_9EURO|nr:hypothetical protein ACN38_g6561 [Penicillium nordicum]